MADQEVSPTRWPAAHGQTVKRLHLNWIWVADWIDNSTDSAARLVTFRRTCQVTDIPSEYRVTLTADTRYKLVINSKRITIGPSRSLPAVWYYDTIDIAPYLIRGQNEIIVDVIRYFPSAKAGLPFVRGHRAGLTMIEESTGLDLSTGEDGWVAEIHPGLSFPMGLEDDVFLHVGGCIEHG